MARRIPLVLSVGCCGDHGAGEVSGGVRGVDRGPLFFQRGGPLWTQGGARGVRKTAQKTHQRGGDFGTGGCQLGVRGWQRG
jgi:hypothetical protein